MNGTGTVNAAHNPSIPHKSWVQFAVKTNSKEVLIH